MTGFLHGLPAGAAGTTAPDATTDAGTAARGPSGTPQQWPTRSAERAGVSCAGDGGPRANRVDGLAPPAGGAIRAALRAAP